jgi:hypothetical protein
MASRAKRILIESESIETLVVRVAGRAAATGYCDRCLKDTAMLDLNSAVTVSGRSARDLIGEIETGPLHSSQTSAGHLLICALSLHEAGKKSTHE